MKSFLLAVVCAAGSVVALGNASSAQVTVARATTIEWGAYAHDPAGTKHSPAAQITRTNVKQLVPVWTYRTGDFALGEAMARDETTPLFVDNMLYASTPFGGVRAIDGDTGAELWSFDPELDLSGNYGDFTNRGVSTWVDPTRPTGASCHRRIFVAPVDARIIALDSRTGAPCADFGTHGQVPLGRDVVNAPNFKGEYAVTSPPAVVNGLVIVGSAVGDGRRTTAPSGVVRAFDARTGALKWSWDPVPRDSTQTGFETWRGPQAHRTGAANAWSIMSVDSARDLVFVPTGSASPDFFGGERLGQNLFANSVVALRASTGAMVWHFQMVHHDLWDYDVPAQPLLFTMRRGARDIPALAQTTKMGHVFILDRETGKPLFPVEERPVPRSDVTGEEAWPTQPFPTLPRPLSPARFDTADVFGASDAGRAWCRAQLAGARSTGIFTPPSLVPTVIFPGNIGGSNWSGMALDPQRHLAIVPTNRLITLVDLIPRADVHDVMMRGSRFDEIAPQTGTPFAMRRRHLIAPDGAPCNPPPWGMLSAIDLETGEVRWERPFGRVAQLANVAGSERWGSPNLGGAMTTAGGVVFAGGAVDSRLHAFDVETGEELWSAQLPAGVHASPMTYVSASGRQFVVVAAGGHRELHVRAGDFDKAGDYIVAFALPSSTHSRASSRSVVKAGHYTGHILLDRTRLRMTWDLTITGKTAVVALETSGIRVVGNGKGRVSSDTLSLDVDWRFPAQNCGGTLRLEGNTANHDTAIVGELSYVDGCAGGGTKPGTFAMWKDQRRETVIAP
ncbi:MAG TPA: pyrroloquinoline quinone-dependent dehydrogenase [Gemmatimonadaceae bacterium]|nr:pyrroloquinoline quinone-dependent dehydrogenase [Gemmatimonadaceae bacterium]